MQTLPPNTPSPSRRAFGALLCRKEFLLNCSSHSPESWTARGPDPVVQQCCFRSSQWEQLCVLQAGFGSEEQRLLQTPDLVVLLISYLLKNAPTVGVFVCLFHFMGVSHPNFFRLSWQRTNGLTGIGELFHSSFSKGILLDYYPLVDIQKSP